MSNVRDSDIHFSESSEGAKYFTYNLGAHLLESRVKTENIDKETAIVNLLEKSLKENNFCPTGYLIEERLVTENGDIIVYGQCTGNSERSK